MASLALVGGSSDEEDLDDRYLSSKNKLNRIGGASGAFSELGKLSKRKSTNSKTGKALQLSLRDSKKIRLAPGVKKVSSYSGHFGLSNQVIEEIK